MSKITFSVIGSCVSRDVFNRKFVPEYKEFYECISTAWQSSIISLMSPKVTLSKDDLELSEEISKHRHNTLMEDLSKEYLEEIKTNQPDYIIIDFYADMRYGVVQIGDRYLTNNPNGFRKTKFFREKKFDNSYRFRKNLNIYRELWEKAFDDLYNYVQEHLPKTKLILNCFRYANSYVNENGELVMFDQERYNYLDADTKLYNELYTYILDKYKLRKIDLRENEYYADGNYAFGLAPWHYERKYHKDYFHTLNQICLRDYVFTKKQSNGIRAKIKRLLG
ncbi:hypothetical protein JOD43_003796 [Pullulanibacillus pueri]|uniref:Uncharacterized protein n=1 Tax=Pullulanibacillus pueri TaxID=1437324 RepID=A0A8J2ZT00_9BACL|nr:DUF6270 domain-containing protein [Pullulanibacillus pueri]MBM7683616.1 hypothetical protein [Pullulanibacillus pueri]GGH76564.1 hypothetical protein GCM10007096_07180 [Pullulanibacillus pueri]